MGELKRRERHRLSGKTVSILTLQAEVGGGITGGRVIKHLSDIWFISKDSAPLSLLFCALMV
jgi:hypothetical protein